MLGDKLKYLEDRPWATLWPNISLVLFTLIFIIIIIAVIRYKKSDVQKWENMPLDDDNDSDPNNK
jgi:hypothetical protein